MNKILKQILVLLIMLGGLASFAQVGINTDNSNPDPSAMLDVKSSDKGVLIPRMTQAERDLISSPATGLMIYQTDQTTGFYYYSGSGWITLRNVETDPKVGTLTPNKVPNWNGTTLQDGLISDDGSNIGIGAAPSNDYKIFVDGNARFGKDFDYVDVHSYGGGFRVWQGIDQTQYFASLRANAGGPTYTAELHLNNPLGSVKLSTPKDTTSNLTTSGDFWITNGSSLNMSLRESGKIGIGTTTPTQKLDVNGKVRVRDLALDNSKDSILVSDGNGTIAFREASTLGGGGGLWTTSGSDIYYNGGNVGIGLPNPAYDLHILGTKVTLQNTGQGNGTAYMDFESSTAGGAELTVGVVGGSGEGIVYHRTNQALKFGTNDQLRMTISNTGNVGIGTSSPGYKLDVRGNMRVGDGTSAEQDLLFSCGSGSWQVGTNNQGNGTSDNHFYVYDSQAFVYRLTVQRGTGNVGIGTTNPQSKLAVNGTITCKEVDVTLAGFPDYVFDEGYDLLSLEEVENHINTHGHLPNIPSAEEVKENGIGLGELNKILLEKVEELTLHLIQKEKDHYALLLRVNELEKSINHE